MSDNRGVILIFLMLLLSGFAQASESEYAVPESWKLIASSQGYEITQIAIRGKWLAWIEKELDPNTAQFRAQSFFIRLYRKNLDTNEIELLFAPENSLTWGEHFVLGANGVVSYDYRGKYAQTLYIPGNNKIVMSSQTQLSKRGEDTPIKIYSDSLLCRIANGINIGIAIIPFDGNEPYMEKKIKIPEPENINNIDYREDAFWNGTHLLYTKTTKNMVKHLELYDTKEGEFIWSIENYDNKTPQIFPVGLSRDYAYYIKYSGNYELIKRPIQTDGKTEKISNKLFTHYPIDLYQERLLSIFKEEDSYFIAEMNLASGFLSKYDISLPNEVSFLDYNNFHYMPYSIYDKKPKIRVYKLYIITGDAESGRCFALLNNNIYEVPKSEPSKIEELEWVPSD